VRVRPSIFLVFALALATLGRAQENVLIIVADDLGVDAVGAYGEGANPPPTPNIDALAANGVMFRNCWSSPLCSPTRALLQTGRYAFRTGIGTVIQWRGGLPALLPEEVTLPELLDTAQSGYGHAAIGKWHLSNLENGGFLGPNLAGWSYFAGEVPNPTSYLPWTRTVNNVSRKCNRYMTTQNVDDALEWILTAPEPWVCYVSFFAPHRPLHAPPGALHSQNLEGLNPQQNPVPFFRAMVEAMDTEIGRLLGSVSAPVMQRTNVMFMGDNGTDWAVTEPPFVVQHGKGTIYEGGINVPLIVSGPIVGSPGREESALVGLVDLYPTIAAMCGVDQMPSFVKIDGVSFVPHLVAPNQPPTRSTVYSEFFDANPRSPRPAAIRDQTHKLIRRYEYSPPKDEFYDLVADPFELNDLLGSLPLSAQAMQKFRYLDSELRGLRDTSPRITLFGGEEACVGSRGVPRIAATGQPAMGSSYTVRLAHAYPYQPAFLVTGASASRWGALPLPFAMQLIGGGENCDVRVAIDVNSFMLTDGSGGVSASVPVPNSVHLVGATLYHQWLAFDLLAPNNPLNLTTTEGLAARIGF